MLMNRAREHHASDSCRLSLGKSLFLARQIAMCVSQVHRESYDGWDRHLAAPTWWDLNLRQNQDNRQENRVILSL
jgi:hypothetical protein